MKTCLNVLVVIFISLAILGSSLAVAAADIPRMTKEELKELLDKDDVIILDVRKGRDWSSSESKIKGAVREDAQQVGSWASKFNKESTYVLYCA